MLSVSSATTFSHLSKTPSLSTAALVVWILASDLGKAGHNVQPAASRGEDVVHTELSRLLQSGSGSLAPVPGGTVQVADWSKRGAEEGRPL